MSKATEKDLSEVHADYCAWCKTILRGVPLLDSDGRAVLQPDGQPWLVAPSSGHMAAIRQFLKDNHIEVGPGVKAGPLHGLAGLPEFSEDGNVVPIHKGGAA